MSDELISVYRKLFDPDDGYLHVGLAHEENGTKLQLGIIKDYRFTQTKRAVFHAAIFEKGALSATREEYISDTDLPGWMKARFPKLDWRKEFRQEILKYARGLK